MKIGACVMVKNFYVFGNLLSREPQGLVSFESLLDLHDKKERLLSLVNEVKESFQGEALATMLERLEYDDLFYFVGVDKSDLRVSASYMRACTISYYDESCHIDRNIGLAGLRSDETYFHEWVGQVRKHQLEVITTLVCKVMCDQVSQTVEESFDTAFEEEVFEPLSSVSEVQTEAFYLASVVHHYVSKYPELYNVALCNYDKIIKVTNCVSVGARIYNGFKQLTYLSKWFENVATRDLSGIVMVNTQLGVIEFSAHAQRVSNCERLNCNMIVTDRGGYLS